MNESLEGLGKSGVNVVNGIEELVSKGFAEFFKPPLNRIKLGTVR